MATQSFSRMGASRSLVRRERMLFLGGGTLMFSLVLIVALLIYSHSPVDAGQQFIAEPEINNEIALNAVVLIAPTAPVRKGEKLSRVPLREMYWPRDKLPEGSIRDIESVHDMYAKVDLPANQPILSANLSQTPLTFGLDTLLPPGHRAVAINVDATSSIEGWASAGAHVDVLVTYLDGKDGVNKTRIVVEDAVVLSYDGNTKRDTKSEMGRVSPASTVTLAVNADDTLKISTARAMGRISLTLRNPNDPKSAGKDEFGADEWDSPAQRRPANKNRHRSIGFAEYRDSAGNVRSFTLDNDARWYSENGLDNDG